MDETFPYYGVPFRSFVPLAWRNATPRDAGALWNGARWVAPPFGPASVFVPRGIVRTRTHAVRDATAVPKPSAARPWLPYWQRRQRPSSSAWTAFAGGPGGSVVR